MPAPAGLVREHRDLVNATARAAAADVESFAAGVAGVGDPVAARVALEEAMTAVIEAHSEVVGTAAQDYYDELRAAARARGRFSATVRGLPVPEQITASTRWAVGPLFGAEPDIASTVDRLLQVTDRLVRLPSMATTAQNAWDDPASARYYREVDESPCAFCRMLASRGAVYRSDEDASGGFRAHFRCGCQALPAFSDDDVPEFNREMSELWDEVTAGLGGADARKAWAEHFGET